MYKTNNFVSNFFQGLTKMFEVTFQTQTTTERVMYQIYPLRSLYLSNNFVRSVSLQTMKSGVLRQKTS